MSKSAFEAPPLSVDLPTHEEMLACMAACFEWADSYDTKDWKRLARCIAPELTVDYRSFLDKKWDAMPADEFVEMASSPAVLGDPLLRTQHLIAGSRWHKVSPTLIHGYHQLRVPHQKYTDATLTTVKVKGHAHSTNKHWYRRVTMNEGGQEKEVWKFAGLAPDIRWSEYDFEKVFEEGRDALGEDEMTAAGGEKVNRLGETAGDVAVGEKQDEVMEDSVAMGLGVGTGPAVGNGVGEGGPSGSESGVPKSMPDAAAVVAGIAA